MAVVGRRGLAPLLVLAAIALLVLLAFNLRNLDPGRDELPPPIANEKPPGEAARGAGSSLRDLYVAFMFVLCAGILIGAVIMVLRGESLRSLLTRWDLLGFALALAFVLLAFAYWSQISTALENLAHAATSGTNQTTPGTSASGTSLPTAGGPGSAALLLAVAIVGGFALLFAAIFLSRLYEVAVDTTPSAATKRREFARTVGRAIADLEAGEDFRTAVLRCYASMLVLFEGHGLRADPSQTAREFESDALGAVGVSRAGIDDLTSLFEEARYSTHSIGEVQRDAAIASLSSIRTQLEAAV